MCAGARLFFSRVAAEVCPAEARAGRSSELLRSVIVAAGAAGSAAGACGASHTTKSSLGASPAAAVPALARLGAPHSTGRPACNSLAPKQPGPEQCAARGTCGGRCPGPSHSKCATPVGACTQDTCGPENNAPTQPVLMQLHWQRCVTTAAVLATDNDCPRS